MDAKSKRDLIWEEKKRQREERMLRLEGMINDVEQRPISIPTQPKFEFEYMEQRPPRQPTPPQQFQERYQPPQPPQQFQERIQPPMPLQQMQPPPQMDPVKKQQQEYRDFLKQQMEQKEQEKRNRKSSAVRDQNEGQNYNQGNTPIVNHKQEYAEALRQQMRDNQEVKQRDRISSGLQQQNDPSILQKKQQKQEYGDYLRMQMQSKNQKPIDKKEELQRKFEQQDAFIINNRVGPGAGPSKQIAQDQYQYQAPQYNQPPQQQYNAQNMQQQQYNQPSQYIQPMQQQQQFQQPQQYQNQFQQQQNQFQMPQQNQFVQQPSQNQFAQQPQQNQFSQQNQFMQQNQYYKEPQQPPNQQFYQQPLDYDMMVQESAPQPEPQLRVGRNRLAMENVNLDDVQKKEKQKLEMQRVLQEQIEEKKRKKEQEKQQKELEDRLEEERLKKEKQLIEDEKKREDEQKKQKQGAIIQDNVDLKEQRRLQRLQERKNRNNPQENQQNIQPQVELPIQEFNMAPPSQPASDHFLRDYMNNEKIKEGLNPDQSILDFYKNGRRQQEVPQSNREIEEIKRQMVQNQEQLQQQLQTFMQQAQQAIESRNRAENELLQLKQQVKNKYIQEEKHHEDLMVALVKNDPKWEKQVFPPHLLAQAEIAEYRNLAMPEIKEYNLPPQVLKNQFQPVYESKPLVFKDEPQKKKQEFREEFGLQSLVSDSNMVPIDHYNGSIMQQRLPQIDELENHNEETQKYEHKPIQTWNMASVDSDIVKEIDQLLNYKPQRPPSTQKQQQLKNPIQQRPPSNDNRQLPSSTNRPASTTLNRAGLGVLGGDYRPITLDQDFPDLTMQRRDTNQDTLDIGAINRRNDQKLLQLNDYTENDDDIRKLDSLLHKYNF